MRIGIKAFTMGLAVSFLIGNGCSPSKTSKTPAKPAPPATVSANVAPGIENEILSLVNQHRAKKGLKPLESNFVITSEARRHTMEMATRKVPFGHKGMESRAIFIRTKIPGVNAVAENVAFNSQSAQAVVDGWLKSPGHKKNIEGPYRLTGIGVARNVRSQLYFTQIFAD